jgi:guanylate kinase
LSDYVPLVIVVSGPSGAGKSTILQRVLLEVPRLRFSVSHTTRPPRPGPPSEREGVDYYFVSRDEFQRLATGEKFLEWAEVHGQCYGTAGSEYDRAAEGGVDLLLDLNVQGAQSVRKKFPDAVSIFILPPSYEHLERRLRSRGPADEATYARRLQVAGEELRMFPEYDYAIINDDLDESVESLKAIIRAGRSRTSRVEPAARKILNTFDSGEKEN